MLADRILQYGDYLAAGPLPSPAEEIGLLISAALISPGDRTPSEFKANAPDAAVTPAAQALRGQLDAACTRITSLEQENAALRERVRTLAALVVEMNLEADGKTNVIPLKR